MQTYNPYKNQNPADVYLQNLVENANPIRLVILLYDKAITCIEDAIDAIKRGLKTTDDVKIKAECLTRAIDILIVLKASLDKEKGKDIAKNLEQIYDVLINELVEANIRNDAEKLKKIKKYLEELRDAWEDAERNVYGNKEVKVANEGKS